MAVSGDSAAIKQMLNNMSSEELLKYYDGDSSISTSLFSDRTFPLCRQLRCLPGSPDLAVQQFS